MSKQWPFKVPDNATIRILDQQPSSIFGVMPREQAEAWMSSQPEKCDLPVSPPRVPVEVKSINGVPQPKGTKLFLRPVTLEKIMNALSEGKQKQ